MDLRLRELGALDPLAVPLPSGTEVTTRVDRVLTPDRRVPQGAVGRVVAQRGDELDVMVVGVGVLRYARSELVPRKIGQVRYARRRADAWDALRPCTIVEATVGSRAWGLADEGSDTDLRGVFVLPFGWSLGLGDPPRDLVSADGSATYWEAGKAVRQALRADPNTLELLFVAEVKSLVQGALSRRIFAHYRGFATSQLKAFQADGGGSAKKLLYVLRTALTGAHALRTGRVVIDLRELHHEYGFADAGELIEAKRAGETIRLSADLAARWEAEVQRAFGVLEEAYQASSLPAEPPNARELEGWLLEERRSRF